MRGITYLAKEVISTVTSLKAWRVNIPFEAWLVAPHQTADMVYEAVLSKVGATLPKRDAVDEGVTEMVRKENHDRSRYYQRYCGGRRLSYPYI